MNHYEVAAHIGDRYGAYLAAVGREPTYSTNNLKPPIDDAYLALGYAEADIATLDLTDVDAVNDLKAMAAYTAMAQIVRDLGAKAFDIGTSSGSSFKLNQRRAAAEKDLALAEAAVVARGLSPVPLSEAGGITTLDLNFLEPSWVGW